MNNAKTSAKVDSIRVLHVDDDPLILKVSDQILTEEGNFEIEQANCVDEALNKLSTRHFDVVISDFDMPQKDGLEFLKELRDQKNEIPFILFTGKGREEVAIEALNLGADAYINKQGNPETVYGELSHALIRTIERKTSAESIKKNEAQLEAIILNAPIGIALSDSNSLFVNANQAFCKIVGYSEDELRKLTFKDFTVPEDIKESNSKMRELIEGKISFFSQEKRYIKKDGTTIHGKVTVSAIRNNDGTPNLFVAELEDITKQKLEKEALKDSEAKLRSIIENSTDQIFMIDSDYRYLSTNKALSEVLGKQPEDIIGKTISEVYPLETATQFRSNIKNVFSTGKSLSIEEKLITAQSKEIEISTSLNPAKDETGKVIAVAGIVRDITERKKIEQILRENEERLRLKLYSVLSPDVVIDEQDLVNIVDVPKIQTMMDDLYEVTKMAFALLDLKGNVLVKTGWQDICTQFHRVSPQTAKNCTESDLELSSGVKQGDFRLYKCKNNMWDIVTPLVINEKHVANIFSGQFFFDDEEVDRNIFAAKAEKYGFNKEEYLSAFDKVPRWNREKVQNFMFFITKFSEMISKLSFSNLKLAKASSEQKTIEAALRESQTAYKNLINGMSETVWVIDFEGNFIDVNDSALQVLGYSKEELLSIGIKGIDKNLSREQVKKLISNLPAVGTQVFETVHTAKNGRQIPVEISSSIVIYRDKKAILSIGRNITERKKAETETQAKDRILASIYANVSEVLFLISVETEEEFRFISVNQSFLNITGLRENQVVGKSVKEVIPEPSLTLVLKKYKQAIHENKTIKWEEITDYPSGRKHGEVTVTPIFDATGRCTNLIGSVHDITERKQAETKLQESQHLNQKILDSTPNLIYIYDLIEHRNVYANKEVLDFLGYTPEQIKTMGSELFIQTLHPEDAQTVANHHARFANTPVNAVYEVDYRMKHASGHWHWLHSRDSLFARTKEGIGSQILGSCEDITETKQMKEALQKSEERFRQVSNNAQEWIWEVDTNGLYTYSSPIVEKLLGYNPEELVGKKYFYDLFLDEEKEELKKASFGAFDNKSHFKGFINKNIHKNGKICWLSTSGIPILDEKSNLLGYRGLDIDITERKEMENNLKISEEKFRRQFEEAFDPIFVADTETGIIVDCNQAACKLVEREKTELIGLHQRFIHPSEEREGEFSITFGKHLKEKQGQILEAKVITKAGEIRNVEISAKPLKIGNKNLIQASFRDITEHKKAEESLRKSEERYRSLADSLPEIVFETDVNGKVIYANETAFKITGYTKEDLAKGVSAFDLIEPKNKAKTQENFKAAVTNTQTEDIEYVCVRKDGNAFPIIVKTNPLVVDNVTVGLRGIAVDIAQLKKVQEEIKKDQKNLEIVNEKLHVVGRLNRHDVGNKLMIIRSNIFLLKKLLGNEPKYAKYFESIDSAIVDSDKLFEFSRLYEKIGAEKPSVINVGECFRQATSLLPDAGAIKIVNECQSVEVFADSMLRQLFFNFIENSLKHGEKVTQIRLIYTTDENGLNLIYEDDGIGIPHKDKAKLFTEGFSTGKGTGLGLALIKKMIEVHNWTIQENGEPDKGARFVITVPKAK